MHVCAQYGNEVLFQNFLKMKGDYLSRNYADETPFHIAAWEGRYNMLVFYRNHFQFDIDIDTMVCKKNVKVLGWLDSTSLYCYKRIYNVFGIPS